MKMIIDIPEGMLEAIKDGYWSGSHKLELAIRNGIPYEERPTGEWKSLGFVPSRDYAWCTCSNCGKTTKIYRDKDNDFCCIADIRNKAVACLFCGADMRGEEK